VNNRFVQKRDSRRFVSEPDRAAPVTLKRNGSAAHRLTRRANALLVLAGGSSCEEVAQVLYLDDDSVRFSTR
jgi:hypothetical protein